MGYRKLPRPGSLWKLDNGIMTWPKGLQGFQYGMLISVKSRPKRWYEDDLDQMYFFKLICGETLYQVVWDLETWNNNMILMRDAEENNDNA